MIRRGKHSSNYTQLPNETLSDGSLSFEARGVLVYLLSKPENWIIQIYDICNNGKIGRDKAYRVLKELEESGYLDREQGRDDSGRMSQTESVVYDLPVDKRKTPCEENQDTVNPCTEKPDTENKHLYKDYNTKKTIFLQKLDARTEKIDKTRRRSSLPPDCPSGSDRESAIAYWRSKGREDLTASVERSADKFRAYHEGKGTLAVSWAATWRTWYVTQIDIIRPPAGYMPSIAHRSQHSEFRDPSAFTPEDWQTRVCMALADNSKWIAEWGEPPRPGLSPEVQAIGYFEQHQKAKKE